MLAVVSNNFTGVAGVTWKTRILPLLVVDANDSAAYSDIVAAIEYAAGHGARVATSTPRCPAACGRALAVSATDAHEALAPYSSFGAWIGLAAPTERGGGYEYRYGTSFASPMVAGVARMAWGPRAPGNAPGKPGRNR